jgi:hypothetical protein
MRGDEHDPRGGMSRTESHRAGDPVQTRHHDVGDDHVGVVVVHGPEKGISVGYRGPDVELCREQAA